MEAQGFGGEANMAVLTKRAGKETTKRKLKHIQ
jgi:sugar/nucleoside kinase (ribokinase family)